MIALITNKSISIKSETNQPIKFTVAERGKDRIFLQLIDIGNAETVFVTFVEMIEDDINPTLVFRIPAKYTLSKRAPP
jgi:precorrin isomerase